MLLTLWNLFAHVEQVECLVLTGELREEEYPVLSRLAGEIQELLDPPRPALAELGLEGLPASGALCRAMERYRHNARLLLEAWEKQPVSCLILRESVEKSQYLVRKDFPRQISTRKPQG